MIVSAGDEVSIMPVVYSCGPVSISPLGYLSSFDSSSKNPLTSLPLYFRAHHIQWYPNKKREKKIINPQQDKSRCEE